MDLSKGDLYIGRELVSDEPVVYQADDLTTHGVIVGMTGSGKTGLGVDLIEEALLNDISCLVIDPKGDMGNLALTFPDLTPDDFSPWVDEATARKEGKTREELAEATADLWRAGLEGHGIGPEYQEYAEKVEGFEVPLERDDIKAADVDLMGLCEAAAVCGSLVAEPLAGEHCPHLELGLLGLDRAPAGW